MGVFMGAPCTPEKGSSVGICQLCLFLAGWRDISLPALELFCLLPSLFFESVFCFAAEVADVLIIFQRNVLAPQIPRSSKSWMHEGSSTNSTLESTCPCMLASMSASNALWKFGINLLEDHSCCWIFFFSCLNEDLLAVNEHGSACSWHHHPLLNCHRVLWLNCWQSYERSWWRKAKLQQPCVVFALFSFWAARMPARITSNGHFWLMAETVMRSLQSHPSPSRLWAPMPCKQISPFSLSGGSGWRSIWARA